MPVTPLGRLARALVVLSLASGLAFAAGSADATSARRLPPNTSGTQAGSAPNGAGNLSVSLATTTYRGKPKLQVSFAPWRGIKTRDIKKWVVKVGPNHRLDSQVRTTTFRPAKRLVLVDPAFGVSAYSGNFSFVKVQIVLKKRNHVSGSPTKWIKAPNGATCTASPANRVTVGTFNVRQWGLDRGSAKFNWNLRGPRVIDQILSSGARVVALQEASGQKDIGYGGERQWTWILKHLNAADPAHHWSDALADDAYANTYGPGVPGLIGTRVFYDDTKYTLKGSGLTKLGADALLPWAELKATDGSQPAFVFAGTHLKVGETAAATATRGKQIDAAIQRLRGLASSHPGEQVIVAGDMNSTVNTKPYNTVQVKLLAAGFYDAFSTTAPLNSRLGTSGSYVLPMKVSPNRRDYIMSYGAVKGSCGYANRAYSSINQVASDHFMQVATLPLATN